MAEWKKYKIGDLCQSVSDTYKGHAAKVVLINTSDVLEGKITNHELVDNINLKGQFKKTFCKDDILYSEIRPANKRFAYVDFDTTDNYIASTKLMVIRADKSVIRPKYLYTILKSEGIISQLQQLAETRSGTFPQITFGAEIAPMEITVPNKQIQDKIVAVLETIDNKIEENKHINHNLQQQIQAIYDSWFKRFEPFSRGKFTKSELGDIPFEWTVCDIYSIATVIYGAPFASPLFNTEKKGMPIVRIRDLKGQCLDTYTTEKHPKGHLLQLGDIVVGMDGEFRPYIWGNDAAWLNQRVCVFNNKRVKGKAFLYCTLKPLLRFIEETEAATTVIHIGKKDFDAFRVVIPPQEILDSFDSITNDMYWQIVHNQLQNRRLAVLRDVLLPKLMSGEIDVSNVEI